MTDDRSRAALRYRAFLSYSHRDAAAARKLHRWLERYRVPAALRKERIAPVFRDRDELASSSALGASLEQALDASEALVVVCSPAAAASKWVNEEVRTFRTRHPDRPVLAFVVAGDPGLDPRSAPGEAAFPLQLALADVAAGEGALGEPVAADARAEGDGWQSACLRIAAGLLDVRFDDLARRELQRRKRVAAIVAGASLLLTSAFAYLAWSATVARDEARRAQARAELELQSEQQTRNFLLSVFRLADAGEARGNSVTVREVLDRAVARIDDTEFARPAIKSRFLASMGQAYSSLGLLKRSAELLSASLGALPAGDTASDSVAQAIDSRIELADVQYAMGEYDAALATLAPLERAGIGLNEGQQARAGIVRGDVLSRIERGDEARPAYESAVAMLDHAPFEREERALIHSRALTGLGFLALDAGDNRAAKTLLGQAVDVLVPVVGEIHPASVAAMASQAAAAQLDNDLTTAKALGLRALAAAERVYADDSPDIGTIKNNLGRILLETGDLDQAEPLLRAAVASDRRFRSADFDDSAFSLHNLAYVLWAKGNAEEAKVLLEEALPIAEATRHRMLGPILNALADIDCAGGDEVAGAALAERAVEVNRERAGTDHWTTQQAELTAAFCRAQQADADAIFAVIVKRFGRHSAFALRASAQRVALQSRRGQPAKS